MNTAIVFENVTKSFGDHHVVTQLDWSLPEHGTICLFGPSGCGKTTLLHLLAGICRPDSGRILGLKQRKVSMVFQEPRLLPWLSATHNVTAAMPQDLHPDLRKSHERRVRESREKLAKTWLARVGLADAADKLPDELSGGMRQRVALARALAHGGDLLLLDEPTQGLDAATRDDMIRLIREGEGERLTVLVTHDPDEAQAMVSSVVHMSGPPVEFDV